MTPSCNGCGEPVQMTCACSPALNVGRFADLDTGQMAQALADLVLEGDRRDAEERAKPARVRGLYLGYDWFMWTALGREIANLDSEAGERARSFVLQIYHGMMRALDERLGDWRRARVPLEECAQERGAVR